jgi:Domain of unknown function (DUF3303)
MLILVTLKFRQGASKEENQAAARLLLDRLQKPNPGNTILNAVANVGAGEVHVLAEATEQALTNVRYSLEFRVLPAVESIEVTPVVDAKTALETYLSM